MSLDLSSIESNTFSLIVGFGSSAIVSLAFFLVRQLDQRKYQNSLKNSISTTMKEVNSIFQNVNSLSSQYEKDGQGVTHRLTSYLQKSNRKIDNYLFILQHNSSLINPNKNEQDKIERFMELLDWFTEHYYFIGEPLPKQVSFWEKQRSDINTNTQTIETISKTFFKEKKLKNPFT